MKKTRKNCLFFTRYVTDSIQSSWKTATCLIDGGEFLCDGVNCGLYTEKLINYDSKKKKK